MVEKLDAPLEYLEVMGIEGNAARFIFHEFLITLTGRGENQE